MPALDSLPSALEAIHSPDVREQNDGVARVLELGASAVPGLLDLLESPGAPRPQVMYALSRLADTRASAAFEAGLHDAEEGVRAHAAVGLARIHHPAALAALLQTLDDAPDMLHLDITPAVQELPSIGLAAVSALLERMDDAAPMTRLHAQRAFEGVVARLRLTPPPGAAYAHDAAPARRRAAVQRWRETLAATERTK